MADASLPSVIKMAQFIVSNQARTQLFRRGGGGGGCTLSLSGPHVSCP